MKSTKLTAVGIIALAALAITGCSNTAAQPVPSPTVMNKTEAADLYLSTVCPNNVAGDVLFQALNADPADLEAIKAAAAEFASTQQKAAETFDDSSILWPKNIREDMPVMADDAFSILSWISQIQAATTIEQTYIILPDTSEAGTASQKIRSRLGLSSDTTESCKDYK